MWTLEFWKDEEKEDSPLRKDIEKIRDKKTIKTMLKLFRLLEEFGPTLPMPNNKFIGGDVFELRDRALGRRYYYAETKFVMHDNSEKRIILLLAMIGNKDSQQRDIELAKKRLSDLNIANVYNPKKLKIERRK